MKVEIQASGAELLEKICAEASAEGQPLSDLEKRCLQIALDPQQRQTLAEIEKEFPNKESYDAFVARAARLVERAVVHVAESQPQFTPQTRAALEKFLSGGGEAVVGSVLSMAMFGRVPPLVRAAGIAGLVVPLAVVAAWFVYSMLASGQLSSSNKFFAELILALVIVAGVSSILHLVRKASER